MKFNILVVDDERNIREGLATALEMEGYAAATAANGKEAMEIIQADVVDLVITDLRMPEKSGHELLQFVVQYCPSVPVIILTGHGTIETAVQSMHEGAYDFVTKPVNLDRLSLLVRRALSNRELALQHRAMQEELEKQRGFKDIIGKSPVMRKVYDVVQQVAPTKASVLITGESGVGKELIANAIHATSPRKNKPLIRVHCAALSESLLESELFGHEKGSFTGATARKRGRFELANGGTIFLDEIGEVNQAVQIKILRVLQEKTFERVGGEETIEVDVRIVTATNRDLKQEIETGAFREDLFYRLNVVNIHVPPLRERKEDIPLLIAAFVQEFAEENGKPVEGIDPRARSMLYRYAWPGNIRELRNSIESAVVMCKGTVIQPEDLPPSITENDDAEVVRVPLGSSLDEVERQVIEATLLANKGNKSRTAEVLGIGRKTLHRKIHEFGIED